MIKYYLLPRDLKNMKIIKLENQKNDSFFEAECFLHIGESKEDKNYAAFDLRREDDPLYSCSYYDFEKEKGNKIFHCFDGQDYSWKCFENEVTNDEKLKNEILGNYDILRNSTIRYLKEIIHKNKVDFSKKLIELLEKIKVGEKINKKEFWIELKKVGLYKSIWKEKTEIFDDVVTREIGFENIMKFIEENNVNRVIFEDGKFLEKEEIRKYIKEYTIVEFRDFKPIKDFDMIKMTLEEWNNLKKWKKLEVENNIIEIEEKDFEKDVSIYRLNGRKINAKIEVTDFMEIKNNFLRYFNKWFNKGKKDNLREKPVIKGVIRDGRKFYNWIFFDKNNKVVTREEYDEFGKRCDLKNKS